MLTVRSLRLRPVHRLLTAVALAAALGGAGCVSYLLEVHFSGGGASRTYSWAECPHCPAAILAIRSADGDAAAALPKLRDAMQAAKTAEDASTILYNTALVYVALERWPEARVAIDRSIELRPDASREALRADIDKKPGGNQPAAPAALPEHLEAILVASRQDFSAPRSGDSAKRAQVKARTSAFTGRLPLTPKDFETLERELAGEAVDGYPAVDIGFDLHAYLLRAPELASETLTADGECAFRMGKVNRLGEALPKLSRLAGARGDSLRGSKSKDDERRVDNLKALARGLQKGVVDLVNAQRNKFSDGEHAQPCPAER